MKQLVIVADDFGFSGGVNKGTIEAYTQGILTQMDFMVGCPGSDEAVEQILEQRIKDVGIHLSLMNLVETGKYLRTEDYEKMLDEETPQELQAKIREEFKKFEGLFDMYPTHISGHHQVHQHEKIIDAVAEYAGAHGIYVRKSARFSDGKNLNQDVLADDKIKQAEGKITDYIFEHIVGGYEEVIEGFVNNLNIVQDNTVTEIFLHPAYLDDTLKKHTSLLDDRERDLRLLKDPNFKNQLTSMGFNITSFRKL
jgi:chitin disaccharide deacetylase